MFEQEELTFEEAASSSLVGFAHGAFGGSASKKK